MGGDQANIYVTNSFFCYDSQYNLMVCGNDCPGVNPNAIIVGEYEFHPVNYTEAIFALGVSINIPSLTFAYISANFKGNLFPTKGKCTYTSRISWHA